MPGNDIVRTPRSVTAGASTACIYRHQKSKTTSDSLQQAGFVVFGWDLEWHYDHKTLALKNTADGVEPDRQFIQP
jgi:hypothetical protein